MDVLIDKNVAELVSSIFTAAFIIFLAGRLIYMSNKADRLARLNNEFSERLLLYKGFNNNISVVKMLKIIDTVRADSLDSEMSFRLKRYFKKSFTKLKVFDVVLVLRDIESSKHSDFVMSAFTKATKADMFLPGTALFRAIANCNEKEIEILNNFLEKLPLDKQIEQFIFTVKCLNNFLENELGDQVSSEYRTALKLARENLKERIETE